MINKLQKRKCGSSHRVALKCAAVCFPNFIMSNAIKWASTRASYNSVNNGQLPTETRYNIKLDEKDSR